MENQRIRVSKRMLKEAFMDLLNEKEIGKIKISELCERAQINRATFYKYYGNQYDLLAEIEADFFSDLDKFFARLSLPDPEVLSKFLNYMAGRKDTFNILTTAISDQEFSKHLLETPMIQDIFSIRLKPGYSPIQEKYLKLFIFQGVYAVMREWINSGCPEPTEEITSIIHDFL